MEHEKYLSPIKRPKLSIEHLAERHGCFQYRKPHHDACRLEAYGDRLFEERGTKHAERVGAVIPARRLPKRARKVIAVAFFVGNIIPGQEVLT